MINYYIILGVSEKATEDEIKQAYRALAKKYHPDLHPGDAEAAKKFAQVNEAMETLGDTTKRKAYDDQRLNEKKQAEARAAAARAAAQARANPGMGARPTPGMGARPAYAGSAAGAQAVINDAYRKGFDAGVAQTNAQRNASAETWKRSADSWQKEAEARRKELDKLRDELEASRRAVAEAEAEGDRLAEALRAQIAKTRDARLDGEVESAAAADLRETLEGKIDELKKTIADLENKMNMEREARKYSDADKVRLSREITRLREENAELKAENSDLRSQLGEWEAYGESEDENDELQAISDSWLLKVKDSKKQYKNSHYGVLGINFWADDAEVEAAYFAALKRARGKEDEEQRRRKANEAFAVLHDPAARKAYNTSLGITDDEVDALRVEQDEYRLTQERIEEKAEEESIIAYINDLALRANNGDGEAANDLGELYFAGESVEKNLSLAVHWFTLGSDAGNADALYNLGLCYLNGEGVEPNAAHGANLIKRAAAEGCELAIAFIQDANK